MASYVVVLLLYVVDSIRKLAVRVLATSDNSNWISMQQTYKKRGPKQALKKWKSSDSEPLLQRTAEARQTDRHAARQGGHAAAIVNMDK